jgi:hypothetical protein
LSYLYELAVMGAPTDTQVNELESNISQAVHKFNLRLGHEVGWQVRPVAFNPDQQRSAAAVFFGGIDAPLANLNGLLRTGIPVLPVVSEPSNVHIEIPSVLRHLNCLSYNVGGSQRVTTALLECAGLLPRQRRVFVSYRRDEARQAALQMFDALTSRLFDVFLDTHGILPAEDFQAMLWHHLCDSDVLLMLDTPNYFSSRWTSAEYGRALAKGISVLRVGWPGTIPSARTATACKADLLTTEVDTTTGHLADEAVERICMQVESVRSQSIAVRNLNLVSKLRISVEQIGGTVDGVGQHKAVYVQLADGKKVVVYPTVGIPTSTTLHDATTNTPDATAAVLYDHVGLNPSWQEHLDWLSSHIRTARCVKSTEAAWQFADWEA